MKKFFIMMLLMFGIVLGNQFLAIEKVSAEQERYVGTFKDGYDAYMVIIAIFKNNNSNQNGETSLDNLKLRF